MIDAIISADNWNTTYYQNGDLKALIGMESNLNDPTEILYQATIIDEQNIEIFQKSFLEVTDACKYLNYKYAHKWEFKSLINASSGGGCSTCVAH